MEERVELQKDEIIQLVESRTKEVKSHIAKGKRPGDADILWVRGWPRDAGTDQPVNISELPSNIPNKFWSMAKGITKRNGGDDTILINRGYTYYEVGVFIARNIAAFRELMPDIDIRSSNEIKNNVPVNESRFFLEMRPLENLKEVTITFSQEGMADGTTNFNQSPLNSNQGLGR